MSTEYGPTREGILAETLRLHDMRHGTNHCDRKYVQVCGQFQALLFEAAKNLRAAPTTTPSPRHERTTEEDDRG